MTLGTQLLVIGSLTASGGVVVRLLQRVEIRSHIVAVVVLLIVAFVATWWMPSNPLESQAATWPEGSERTVPAGDQGP